MRSTSSPRSGRSADCSTRKATTSGTQARRGAWFAASKCSAASRTCSIARTKRRSGSRRRGGPRWRASALLRADNVSFAYGASPVVRGVTLEVPAGGFVGLLGPNGSGKTTMLRLLAGTRQPQQGQVLLEGVPIARLGRAAVARRMAVVP
ncbi:MAG: hypothetical protein DMF86_06390 [Acidobacteria bacterium]|nr:MAG: hypothetical protein DMF86_06390 [Acidobacteriota bacterium]